jgi:hypothetical protein
MIALFAQVKLYLFGALLIAAGFAYWYHGHVEYKAGKLAGDKEVAALKAQYVTAYDNATSAARAMQSQADAQAMADANKRAAQSEWQLSVMRDTAQAALARSDDFAAKLKEARKHDPTVDRWISEPVPSGVRAAGQSGSR